MNTATKTRSKPAKQEDRLEEMNQKIDLLLQKVNDMQRELDKLNAHYKPLIN